jgi:hypothetical protein
MTPDALTFDLVDRLAAISVSRGRVSYVHENDLYDITNTNFGKFLLETRAGIRSNPRNGRQTDELSDGTRPMEPSSELRLIIIHH